MKKQSAGILLYRFKNHEMEVLLVHPGGPFWAKKDEGAWSIPKGEFEKNEIPLEAARREFKEETSIELSGVFIELKPITQKGGKDVLTWAHQRDIDTRQVKSNTFEMEWPPKSGRTQSFPEVDKAEWFNVHEAKRKINLKQAPLVDDLITKLKPQQ